MAPPHIPRLYRLWHLYIEPVLALTGAYHLHCAPAFYHSYMPPTSAYNPSSQIVYDQLAAAYLFFAFTEAVLLRVVDDLRTWRWIVAALALCDAGHCYAAWCELGTAGVLNAGAWAGNEGVANVLNVLPLLIRVAFLLGVGMGGNSRDIRVLKEL